MPNDAPTTLVIYNTVGQVVRTLIDNVYYTGSHTHTWDGKDDAKQEVPAGTYIAKLVCGEHNATQKITVVK